MNTKMIDMEDDDDANAVGLSNDVINLDESMSEDNEVFEETRKKSSNRITKREEADKKTKDLAAQRQVRLFGAEGGGAQGKLTRTTKTGTSEVWKVGNFTKYSVFGGALKNIVVCETCVAAESFASCEVNLGKSSTASNAESHMKTYHHALYEEIIAKKLASSQASTAVGNSSTPTAVPPYHLLQSSNVATSAITAHLL